MYILDMLLLTDLIEDAGRLRRVLEKTGSCRVLTVQSDAVLDRDPSVIVCDAALDSAAAITALHAALARVRPYAGIPLIVLLRDPSQLAQAQAQDLGANTTLPRTVGADRLIATITALTVDARGSPGSPQEQMVATGVGETGSILSELMESGRHRRAISQEVLKRGSRVVLSAIKRADIRAWLRIVRTYDDATYQHSLLVAGVAAAFALKLGLSPQSQSFISQGALLHDIGKAVIPSAILNKPGRLTASELIVMRQHTTLGYDMLLGQSQLDLRFLAVVRHHHEYLDGTGYPDGLTAERIPDFVRLITVCDIYAAMIERRPYKEPASAETAYAQLEAMGAKLDGALVQAFRPVAQASAA